MIINSNIYFEVRSIIAREFSKVNDVQFIPSLDFNIDPLDPPVMNKLLPYVTEHKLSDVPDVLEVQVIPSSEVKTSPEVPTAKN